MSAPVADSVSFLLVDDLPENLLALERLLERSGLVLLKARSGPEALEQLLKHEVALALIDVQMPGMDGFELAELMRGTERTRRVPIIFVTAGEADRQRRFRGYEAGGVDFIYKPIEPDILRSKAEVFFELFRQRQEVAAQRDELKLATEENSRLLEESRQFAAALKEADQRKDEFLAMLAHELRNPLAPILSAVELLRLTGASDVVSVDAQEIIARQVAHMGRLIDDLLDVARITSGKVKLNSKICDLAAIVRQTVEDYGPALTAAGLKVELDLPVGTLPLMGDPTRLAQVIGNLLHNAGKFTARGGQVVVRAVADREADAALVTIADTGTGMEPAVLARIFQPFSQAQQSLDRSAGGLGLGLALAKGLVELHGGTIRADSAGPGQGSTFSIRLPLAQSALPADETNSSVRPTARQDALKILLIEDHWDAAKSMQMLLSSLGHQVRLALDGDAGLALAREFKPDVVVSDLGLPGKTDGYAVAKALRCDPQLAGAYLIALSGYGQMGNGRRAEAAGFDRHLVKPIDLAALSEVLAAAPHSGPSASA